MSPPSWIGDRVHKVRTPRRGYSKSGHIQDYRPLGIRDDAVTMPDPEATGGLADVDAVITVGGMAQYPFVFFVEGVHGQP
jgi:hypothetical protein